MPLDEFRGPSTSRGVAWAERAFGGVDLVESALLPDVGCRVSDLWSDAELDDDEEVEVV